MARHNCADCIHKDVCALWEIQNGIGDAECVYYRPTLTLQNEPLTLEQVEKVWPGCEKCQNQANWPSWIEKGFVYCPKCGTPLTSWAWEKQVERLEALKDGNVE